MVADLVLSRHCRETWRHPRRRSPLKTASGRCFKNLRHSRPSSCAELANEADDSAGARVARVIGISGVCLDDDDVDDVPRNVCP